MPYVRSLAGVCLSATFIGTATSRAATTAPADPTQQELLQEVRELRAEVKDLRGRLERQESPTTQPVTSGASAPSPQMLHESVDRAMRDADRHSGLLDVSPLTSGWDENTGFVLRSDDGNFLLHPWAFMQVRNTTNYRQAGGVAGSNTTDNGFELPRMKLVLDGNMFNPDFTYQVFWAVSDLAGAAPTGGFLYLQDAWGRYHLPGTPFAVRAGNIRDPFDHEQLLFGTKTLTPERSIVNNVMANGDGIVKGASFSFGYDPATPTAEPSQFRTEIAYTGGMRNTDTTFQEFPTNPASWGAAGRFEYKFFGKWKDYNQFTSLHDKAPLLVVGGGVDYTEAGDTGSTSAVVDAQFNLPDGLSVYGAYLGRYVHKNGGAPATNGGSAAKTRFPDTYDSTFRLQAGYLIDHHFEPFARYEYLQFDGKELAKGYAHDTIQDITLGCNYYFVGHRMKITAAASYLPDGSAIANAPSDLLANRKNEVIVQAQFQLMI